MSNTYKTGRVNVSPKSKLILSLIVFGFCAAAWTGTIRNFDFAKNLKHYPVVYPKKFEAQQRVATVDGEHVLILSKTRKTSTFICTYITFKLPAGTKAMKVNLEYKAFAKPATGKPNVMLRMNYNDDSKKLASAGRKDIVLDQTKEWKAETLTFDNIPSKTTNCQLALFIKGEPAKLMLKYINISSIDNE